MDKITTLKDFKSKKKNKIIENDLKIIIYVYNLTISALTNFKHYQSVMEVISVIQNNKTLCEMYLRKLEKKYESRLEKNGEKDPSPNSTA